MKSDSSRFIYTDATQLDTVITSHSSGLKKVLSQGFQHNFKIKQIAIGILKEGVAIPEHRHNDMDECYYILEGHGTVQIEGQTFTLQPELFINIPAGSLHKFESRSPLLRFLYFCLELST